MFSGVSPSTARRISATPIGRSRRGQNSPAAANVAVPHRHVAVRSPPLARGGKVRPVLDVTGARPHVLYADETAVRRRRVARLPRSDFKGDAGHHSRDGADPTASGASRH
jgi:hypothetical protein